MRSRGGPEFRPRSRCGSRPTSRPGPPMRQAPPASRRAGGAAEDPFARLPAARSERRLPHALAVEDMERLLAQPQGDRPLALRDRAMLELAYASGLRVSEVCGVERRGLDLEARTVAVSGKGRRERVVPFGRAAARALSEY